MRGIKIGNILAAPPHASRGAVEGRSNKIWLIRRTRAPEVFKAWLPYRRIYLWDVIINVRLALPGETEPSSAEVLAWQGISRSPAFPCKSGTPMVLSVPGERLFVRDAFLNDHWIREPCLKNLSAVLFVRFGRMNPKYLPAAGLCCRVESSVPSAADQAGAALSATCCPFLDFLRDRRSWRTANGSFAAERVSKSRYQSVFCNECTAICNLTAPLFRRGPHHCGRSATII
ncbi:hypothetical protein CA85_17400 [Allorhodopirellula solitaria]|uniref:Uncharacterized protein n=1 Tax=Allorhodopirellula solitaria TaxID=2527987 RepID=A0A5C5YHU0_9BACT|nr:hypothetical protein CA85_17400 [Allorhodopirellula solitaria]